eukprot:15475833-Alexandrium_andersonii.AAC.1
MFAQADNQIVYAVAIQMLNNMSCITRPHVQRILRLAPIRLYRQAGYGVAAWMFVQHGMQIVYTIAIQHHLETG